MTRHWLNWVQSQLPMKSNRTKDTNSRKKRTHDIVLSQDYESTDRRTSYYTNSATDSVPSLSTLTSLPMGHGSLRSSRSSSSSSSSSTLEEEEETSTIHSTLVSLPHPSTCMNLQNRDFSPDVYVSNIFQYCLGYTPNHRSSLDLIQPHPLRTASLYEPSIQVKGFFSKVSENQMSQYCTNVVEATRDGNLPMIRSLYSSGQSLSCCNSFGESLLHMACRRGYTDLVRFFIEEAQVSPRRTDDGGRTPLHDALWHRDPQFDIVRLLIVHEPALLLCKDQRGFAPFTYSRSEHAGQWIQFLWDVRDEIKNVLEKEDVKALSSMNTGRVREQDRIVRYKDIIRLFFQ